MTYRREAYLVKCILFLISRAAHFTYEERLILIQSGC